MSLKKNGEREILLETAKIIIKQFSTEGNTFTAEQFICKLTNEPYCKSREGDYNKQCAFFLSDNEKDLHIKKTEKEISPREWEILKGGA